MTMIPMTTDPRTATVTAYPLQPEEGPPPGTLLLASDGSTAARAATNIIVALASRFKATPAVLSIMPVELQPTIPEPIAVADATLQARAAERRAFIAEQVLASGGEPDWPVVVEHGDAATQIAAHARRIGASMVVMGLRRHGAIDRILRDETTLRVMRSGQLSVLGVVDGMTTLPKRIVAAVDFSRASLRAARAAITVAAPDATVYLTCVRPRPSPHGEAFEGNDVIISQGIRAAFARLAEELEPPAGLRMEPVLLEGVAATELLSFATRLGADLIAIGSHRRTMLSRLLLGSVTSAIVRDAGVSVLVVGPR